MTSLFTIIRFWVYLTVIVSSTIVLALTGNFAAKFLPNLHRTSSRRVLRAALFTSSRRFRNILPHNTIAHDYPLDRPVCFPSRSIASVTSQLHRLLRSQPRIDVFFAFILAVLWLTMGGWSVDIIGGVECDALGTDRTPINDGETSMF